MATIHRQHLAMATQFEAWLVGDDVEHLHAVATAVFEEIDRVERLLSRFDPASEVSRVNRLAAVETVLIMPELAEILAECRHWWYQTDGAFDIVASNVEDGPQRLGWDPVDFNSYAREIRFDDPRCQLDFGAYGKGYALDCAANLLERYGVTNALLHGGKSSILARGTNEFGDPWKVVTVGRSGGIELRDLSFSVSANSLDDRLTHDVFDPQSGSTIDEPRLCLAVAATAALAEIVSTTGVITHATAHFIDHWARRGEDRIRYAYFARGDRRTRRYTDWCKPSTNP